MAIGLVYNSSPLVLHIKGCRDLRACLNNKIIFYLLDVTMKRTIVKHRRMASALIVMLLGKMTQVKSSCSYTNIMGRERHTQR